MQFKDKTWWDENLQTLETIPLNKDVEYDEQGHNKEIPREYFRCIFDFAERWANAIELGLKNNMDFDMLALIARKGADDIEGGYISFAQYDAAIDLLSRCWVHGEKLRQWFNNQFISVDPDLVKQANYNGGIVHCSKLLGEKVFMSGCVSDGLEQLILMAKDMRGKIKT